jgi:hypothetical protein
MNITTVLKVYLIPDSSRGGGSYHDDGNEITEESFGVRWPEPELGKRSSIEGLDKSPDQFEAIVMESTFKIRSCD